jgi:hypothetical protein
MIYVRTDILVAVKMSTLDWVVTFSGLLDRYERLNPEDGNSLILRNVGIYLQLHMGLQSKRPTWLQ